VTATAPSTGRCVERSESMATASPIHPRAVMRLMKAIRRPMEDPTG
jgi:hypothetical protein